MEFPVQQGEEAAAGALVEDGRVQALQDGRAAQALAGQEAQGVPGETRDAAASGPVPQTSPMAKPYTPGRIGKTS